MYTTYCLEDKAGRVRGYETTLYEAKDHAATLPGVTILAMRGPYRYEGFHIYRLELVKGKWKRVPLR